MSPRVFRAKKSEWLLWVFYFLAYFTIISFVIVFLRFTAQAIFNIIQYGFGAELPTVLLATLQLLGITYIWVLPWAGLITLFYFMNEHDWKRKFGRFFVRLYLRIPSVAIGVMTLFLLIDKVSITAVMSAIIGFIALPRLIFGWIRILKRTPKNLRDVGLSLGMTRLQLLSHVYLRKEGKHLFQHLLRMTCLLLGSVAPVVYLTSYLGSKEGSMNYLSIEAFVNIIKGHDARPIVWSSLLLLLVLTFLLTPEERAEEAIL